MKRKPLVKILSLASAVFLAISIPSFPFLTPSSSIAFAWPWSSGSDEDPEGFGDADSPDAFNDSQYAELENELEERESSGEPDYPNEDFGDSDSPEGNNSSYGPSYGTVSNFSSGPTSASYHTGAAVSLSQGNLWDPGDVGYDGDIIDVTGNASYFFGTQAQGTGQASLGLSGANLGVQANFLAGAQTSATFQSVLHTGLFDVETQITGSLTKIGRAHV